MPNPSASSILGDAASEFSRSTSASVKIPGADSFLTAASRPGGNLPTPDQVGTQAGTFLNTAAQNFLFNAPTKLLGNSKINQLLGPYIQQQLGNLLATNPTGDLQKLLSRPDPMFSFSWYVSMPRIGPPAAPAYSTGSGVRNQTPGSFGISLVDSFINSNVNPSISGQSSGGQISGTRIPTQIPVDVSWYVQDISVPQPAVGTKPVSRGGRNIYLPDFQDIGTVSIQFYEDVAGSVGYYLESWRQLIRNDFGYYNEMANYMKPITLVTVNPAGTEMFSLEMVDAFPTDREAYQFTSQTGNVVLSQTFSINDLIYTPINPFNSGVNPATFGSMLGGVPSALASAILQQGEITLSNSVSLSNAGFI